MPPISQPEKTRQSVVFSGFLRLVGSSSPLQITQSCCSARRIARRICGGLLEERVGHLQIVPSGDGSRVAEPAADDIGREWRERKTGGVPLLADQLGLVARCPGRRGPRQALID